MIPQETVDSFPIRAMSPAEQILELLKEDFKDSEYRNGYVEAELAARVAIQIRRLREDRGWTQKELAEKAGTKQSAISKLEDPGYGRYSLSVLQKLAQVFDVALDVAFVPFSAAARKAVARLEELSVPSFADDSFFAPTRVWRGNILAFEPRRRAAVAAWVSRPPASTTDGYV